MINETIKEKKEYALETIARAKQELHRLDLQEKQAVSQKGIEKWLGNEFESSSGLTPEFASFAREYKNELRKRLKDEFEIVSFNRGHFYFSGFVKNIATGKLAYFSTSDVRYFPESWYKNILVRTAQHDKDYTGGSNCRATWIDIPARLLELTK